MGILHKDCPRCATTVATYITHCECGFSFDGNEDADPAARLEALVEEERLYEEYLAARAKQAIAAAADAEAAMFEEPDLYYKSTDAEKAIATRDAVLAELNQQKLRTAEILATIEAVKTGFRKVHVLQPHVHKHPEQKPVEPTPAVSTLKAAAKPLVAVPPVIIPPTAPPEPAPAMDGGSAENAGAVFPPVVADLSRAKADDTRAYTAKLEEILMGAKRRSKMPEPVADVVPLLLPAPRASMQPANDRPSAKNVNVVPVPEAAIPATRVATPPPSLSPEEELERAAKAVRSRATEMATRHGVVSADTPPRATPGVTTHADHAGAVNNKTQPKSAASPSQVVASNPSETAQMADTAPTAETKPEPVETVASAETDSPAAPKEPATYTDTRQQMRARHARTAKTQHGKRDPRPVDTHILTNAPSSPAPFISDHPSAVFRTVQAAKAEKIVQAAKAKMTTGLNRCPYCSATHPPAITRCGCGYLFEASFDLPELVLNAKERAELIEGTYQIKRPKPPG